MASEPDTSLPSNEAPDKSENVIGESNQDDTLKKVIRALENYFAGIDDEYCPSVYVSVIYATPYEAECRRLNAILDSEIPYDATPCVDEPSDDKISDNGDGVLSENSDSGEIHEGSDFPNNTFFIRDLKYLYKEDKFLFYIGLFVYTALVFIMMYLWVLTVDLATRNIVSHISSFSSWVTKTTDTYLISKKDRPDAHSTNSFDL